MGDPFYPGHGDQHGVHRHRGVVVIDRRLLLPMVAAATVLRPRAARAANTTWNPADRFQINLTNGNLTAGGFTGSATGGVRSVASTAAGKYYWEVTGTNWAGAPSTGIGIANASATLTDGVSTLTNACAVMANVADIFFNGTNAPGNPTLGARANGDVIGIALDATNKLIWLRVAPAGNWNGSGTANPATSTGGVNLSAISFPVYALVRGAPGGAAASLTANFGDSAFSGAIPSGFTAGFPATSPSAVIAAGTLSLGIN